MLRIVMLSLIYAGCHYAESCYAECCGTVMDFTVTLIIKTFNAYAECCNAECHNLIDCAEYHYAECCYADCYSAKCRCTEKQTLRVKIICCIGPPLIAFHTQVSHGV
jgi:hypothetical protein